MYNPLKRQTMKKIIFALLISVGCLFTLSVQAQMYMISKGTIGFFSHTPLENIEASSSKVKALMNCQTRDVGFIVENTSFEFPNKLMQEHFNEKYMESEKFPLSTFSGKINETVDLTKEGTYKVTVTGKLTIHGVAMERTIPGTITIKNGEITLISEFKVPVKDHKIEIPSVVGAKIAEEITVNVNVTLVPKK
jgi:polyisoprenoid-binding protein YceI